MSYCLNPDCPEPQNRDRAQHCTACGQPLALQGRYRALKAIGQGGFGRTFLGVDLQFPQTPKCVIKQLYFQGQSPAATAKAIALFEQEALRLSQLGSHPQIPTLLAYFETQGQLYLVQEWINGRPLNPQRWCRAKNVEAHLKHLLTSLLPVLQYVHDHNVIHRDIKPENIMLRRRVGVSLAEQHRAYVLIDFGVARVLSQTALIGGATVIGTPGFMAPEQLRGKVLPASDLYSLGATCLQLLTGKYPDEMFDVIEERWRWREALPEHTRLSPELTRLLNAMVEPSLRQRAQSAIALLRELGESVSASEQSEVEPPNPLVLDARSLPTATAQSTVAALPPQLQPTQVTPAFPPLPEPSAEPEEPEVAIRIDYTTLLTALQKKRWRAADEETAAIFCQLVGKRPGSYVFPSEIGQFPCADLGAIDKLWRKYSQDHFGLTVQGEIYQAIGADYPQFCSAVGWPLHNPNKHSYLQYHLRAPRGHLPSRRWMGGTQGWKQAEQLYHRIQACLSG